MYKNKKISLVIPARNEQKLIKPTLENVPKTIDHVYVINDASTDNMVNVIRKIMKKDRRIELINHVKNTGPGIAIIDGYKKSAADGYDICVVIGGDNQMDLKDLPNFLEPIVKGEAEYTKGNRFLREGTAYQVMPWKRFLGNSILSLMTKIASGYWKVFDTQDGYAAITKEAIEKVDWDKARVGYGYPSDFLILLNIYNIKVKDVPRRAIYLKGERQSQIKLLKYMLTVGPRVMRKFFWRINTKYFYQDFHPLIFFYYFGLILVPLGVLLSIKIIINAFFSHVSGNQAILAALLLIMGFQSLLFAMLFDMQQ